MTTEPAFPPPQPTNVRTIFILFNNNKMPRTFTDDHLGSLEWQTYPELISVTATKGQKKNTYIFPLANIQSFEVEAE